MTLGVVTDVAAPVEVYDAMHARVLELTGGRAEGLLVHVARATAAGFQVVDVWESREDLERYQQLLDQLLAQAGHEGTEPAPVSTEFEVRGLVIPRARVAV